MPSWENGPNWRPWPHASHVAHLVQGLAGLYDGHEKVENRLYESAYRLRRCHARLLFVADRDVVRNSPLAREGSGPRSQTEPFSISYKEILCGDLAER
jgi:hypothetical protein